MTQLREQAIEMIKEIPEDKIIYVVNILKNVKDLSGQRREEESAVKRTDNLLEHLELEVYPGAPPISLCLC